MTAVESAAKKRRCSVCEVTFVGVASRCARCDTGAPSRAPVRGTHEEARARLAARIGEQHGSRRIIGVTTHRGRAHFRVRCDACGGERLSTPCRPIQTCVCQRPATTVYEPGTRIGTRVVLATWRCDDGRRETRMICDCGTVIVGPTEYVERRGPCRVCEARAVRPPAEVEDDDAVRTMLAEAGRRSPEVWRAQCDCSHGERCESCEVRLEAVSELVTLLRRPLALAEVGALWGVTRERVRQIECAAMARARRRAEWAAELVEDRDGSGSWSAWGASAEAAAG